METIGIKISQIRNQKALSQEQLAELSKVNVRTIQRIENNETTPRGATLKLLCDALEITPDEIVNFDKIQDNSFIVWLHLSVLLGYVLPLGNIIVPLILWIKNRNKIDCVDSQGKNIINFQIIFSIILFVIILFSISTILIFSKATDILFYYQFGFLLTMLLPILNFIYPIINAIRISKGTIRNFYPTIIRFIK
ncbi:helix-turn-helix domain-containing protein [Paenimyroides tangerinum]|uniref:Helix-turn-helix domain-containing protein n=1 Tax=Paenimyroides tangerinum TaxID=2488728 RepID=A0A3P3W9A7_9FLAO|nr:helix-turn-helix domain-containing protein [Paenimyroides tangerinum]RRJ90576.1 helix-turn-helix domain-containing protein [Paenimyroides tangerinum]